MSLAACRSVKWLKVAFDFKTIKPLIIKAYRKRDENGIMHALRKRSVVKV